VQNQIFIKKKIDKFKKKNIFLPGDKSLSIRFVLFSSLAIGKSSASNLLMSDDVINTIECIKNLGIKVKQKKNKITIYGNGLFGFDYKRMTLDAGNSGTCARLILASIVDTKKPIRIVGDKSLSKRDMNRIIKPLEKFGAKFKKNNGKLPITVINGDNLKSIRYFEKLGSAQCKSAVMITALKSKGKTKLKCAPSRNHTELFFKHVLKLPIKKYKKNNLDIIEIDGLKNFKSFNYNIPSDISSAAFIIVLTLLSNNSEVKLRNINTNPTRTGIIKILNKMGAKIKLINNKTYKGEKISDIIVKSNRNLRAIDLNPIHNSSAIDEFLLIFLVAAVSKGISNFKKLTELNKKESKRLDLGIEILNKIGVKVKKTKNDGLKIWGNPKLEINKKVTMKNYLKDHRIFMVSVIAALTLGGNWKIHDPDSISTSFPNFLKIIKNLGAKIN